MYLAWGGGDLATSTMARDSKTSTVGKEEELEGDGGGGGGARCGGRGDKERGDDMIAIIRFGICCLHLAEDVGLHLRETRLGECD